MPKLITKVNRFDAGLISFSLLGFIFYLAKARRDAFPDLAVYLHAGKQAWIDPLLLYANQGPDMFLYPPVTALLFSPLSWLSPSTAGVLWYGMNLLLIAWMAWELSQRKLQGALAWISILLLARYWLINLRYGQINILVLALMFFAYLQLQRPGQWKAAAALSGSVTLKLFSIFQGLDLLRRRDWKTLRRTIALGFGLLLVPFLFWGADYWSILQEYPQQILRKGLPLYTHNQSLAALLMRLFGGIEFDLFGSGVKTNWTLFELPGVRWIALLIGSALTAVTWRRCWTPIETIYWDGLSAACFSFLFMSHLVWKPYFIFLLPAIHQVITHTRQSKLKVCLPFLLLVFGFSPEILKITMTSDQAQLWAATFDGLGAHFWASLWIWWQWLVLDVRSKLNAEQKINIPSFSRSR